MAIPEKPISGWKQSSGTTIYQTTIKLKSGKKLYIDADVKTGNYEVRTQRGGTLSGKYGSETGNFIISNSQNIPELSSNDIKNLESTIPTKIYEINDIVVKNSTQDDIDKGIGISKSDQEEFREKKFYKTYQETVADEDPDAPRQGTKVNVSDIADGAIKNKPKTRGFGSLYYPSTLNKNTQNQDIIKFTIGTYKQKKLTLNGDQELGTLSGDSSFNNDPSVFLKGKDGPTEIFLPIQPSITDSNTVDWNENRLNPLQVGLLQSGVTIMEEGSSGIPKTIKELENTFEKNPALINVGKLLLAQEAVGAKNVLSRFGGGIVNPNLELLFNGPQLRPFNFNFRLSPRHKDEATQVRTIIRAFKQSMAVKKSTGLFLVTPNVFKIEYLRKNKDDGGYDPHPSLNRIKTCALKSCVVDYTPENSYATYNDSSNTMVSYNMTLQFQELEPVTDADYLNDNNSGEIPPDHIGY